MPGNRSRYFVKSGDADRLRLLKIWGIPEWWSIKPYDCAKQWTLTRWFIEIEFRRRFYRTSNRGIQLWINYNDESQKNLVKTFYENIDKIPEYDQKSLPGKTILREIKEGLELSLELTPIVLPVSSQIKHLIHIVNDVSQTADDKIESILKWCPDLVTERKIKHAFISVDLIGWKPVIKESLIRWLDQEMPSGMGRPLGTVGPQKCQAWARGYYLAYLDLRELIDSLGKPLPKEDDWKTLLSDFFDIEEAEWFFSDEANSMLRAAAEKERYLLS